MSGDRLREAAQAMVDGGVFDYTFTPEQAALIATFREALAADERGGGEGRWRTNFCVECGEEWPCEATRTLRKDGIPHRLAAWRQ